ncbi:hypothetical protein B0H13DRAFT_1878114 [Mycena leptocephala]|nr:hypothetical protein B0H13DRAFT_1878114 [Mycena leptocephala]
MKLILYMIVSRSRFFRNLITARPYVSPPWGIDSYIAHIHFISTVTFPLGFNQSPAIGAAQQTISRWNAAFRPTALALDVAQQTTSRHNVACPPTAYVIAAAKKAIFQASALNNGMTTSRRNVACPPTAYALDVAQQTTSRRNVACPPTAYVFAAAKKAIFQASALNNEHATDAAKKAIFQASALNGHDHLVAECNMSDDDLNWYGSTDHLAADSDADSFVITAAQRVTWRALPFIRVVSVDMILTN